MVQHVDWVIVFMILLSSVEIFVSTMPVGAQVMRVLDIINEVTLWFFIIEVTLRIWLLRAESRFSGLRGGCATADILRVIDFVSTYPFIIQYFSVRCRWRFAHSAYRTHHTRIPHHTLCEQFQPFI